MPDVDQGYDAYYATYYAERLWQLLPAVYRSADTDSFDAPGPLRELINRIGAQVAVVRRSIDRLWADQSIETCDDWVIPYIGDLLGTNLVPNLDARAQRLDVANTVHYRRRKGTLEVLEELAGDITSWSALLVEGFRRLARTRHGLDPALGPAAFPQSTPGDVAALLQAEGMTGLLTGGPIGGLADLRSPHGAALANTPFDEAFHMADFRIGQGAVGRFGIPKLLVFLWRLTRFQISRGTPVAVAGCDGQYVFDPTGREIPLFLPAPPAADSSAPWTPAREWQVPGPLTSSLEKALTDSGTAPPPPRPRYPGATVPARSTFGNGWAYILGDGWAPVEFWPEIGRFAAHPTKSPPEALTVDYCYGFSSMIGAGPYDRALLGTPPTVVGAEAKVMGGQDLDQALSAVEGAGTVTIGDSRTYTKLADVGSSTKSIQSVLVRAGTEMRPVLRPATGAASWTFTGSGDAQLVLDGLTLSRCDVVLRGSFDTVRLTACTVDPGTAAGGSPPIATAADGAPLVPCRIFVEAAIGQLLVDHCILGPVRTRFGGSVETVIVADSIVQGLPATTGPAFTADDIFDPALLAGGLLAHGPVSTALRTAMPAPAVAALQAFITQSQSSQRSGLPSVVRDALNTLVHGPSLYDPVLFATVHLSAGVLDLAKAAPIAGSAQLAVLNRALIDEAFPVALGVAALAVADAKVELHRVTVLGRVAAHRLSANDAILHDFAAVDDVQDGCIRFSAYASGSAIPRQYESAAIPARAPIFTSASYGNPGYAQLLETADTAIATTQTRVSICAGAENNSEMGAFSADLNPVKEQGLLTKYAEYMPLGLSPVIVHVT